MTTRRDFLGLIAVTPVVASFGGEGWASGGWASGRIGFVGEAASDFPMALEQIRNMTSDLVIDSRISIAEHIAHAESSEDGGFLVPDEIVPEVKLRLFPIPNRLYGAYINEDGDAV